MKRYFLIFCDIYCDGKFHESVIVNYETLGSKYPNKKALTRPMHLENTGKFFNHQITNITELTKSDYEDWIGQEHELIEKDVD